MSCFALVIIKAMITSVQKLGLSFNCNIVLNYSSQDGGLWALHNKLARQMAAQKKMQGLIMCFTCQN